METGIFHISAKDILEIKKNFDNKVFLVELEGTQILSISDYFTSISKLCRFPKEINMWATYNDWMMDFTWIDKDKNIAIIIYDFELFMRLDTASKTKIIKGFQENYIPWWSEDAKNHVVGGNIRKLAVYLVD